jgi:hypothetical protein
MKTKPIKQKDVSAEGSKTEVASVGKAKSKGSSEPTLTPKPEVKKPLTLIDLQKELEALRQIVQDHMQLIADLQSMLTLKRKPALNSKIQIKAKVVAYPYLIALVSDNTYPRPRHSNGRNR